MNILILDDQEIIFTAPADYWVEPHDFRSDNVVQVAHPDEFWIMMARTDIEWDLIWLDHDLGDPDYNGRTVTKKLAELGHEGIPFDHLTFWITTMNPHMSQDMYRDLKHYTDAEVIRRPISLLHDLGVNRGGVLINKHDILRRPSGFLINAEVKKEVPLP